MNKVEKLKFITQIDDFKNLIFKINICNGIDFKKFLTEQWEYYKNKLTEYLSRKKKFEYFIKLHYKISLKEQYLVQKQILESKLDIINENLEKCNKHIEFYKKKTKYTPQEKITNLNRLLHTFITKVRDYCISILSLDGKQKQLQITQVSSEKYKVLQEIIEIETKLNNLKGYIITEANKKKIQEYELNEIKYIIENSNDEFVDIVENNI
jgi:hypothetical protein